MKNYLIVIKAVYFLFLLCMLGVCQSCKFIYHCPTYEAHYDYHKHSVARTKRPVIKSDDLKKRKSKSKKTSGKAEFASN
jgi:hypothetical protein